MVKVKLDGEKWRAVLMTDSDDAHELKGFGSSPSQAVEDLVRNQRSEFDRYYFMAEEAASHSEEEPDDSTKEDSAA